ncbi:MAG: alpha/beta fold hydrolase [Bacteroidales bacterium]|jgi:pimeloyl-ACP methyl ester carboxylesterase|nr:alpha/beta fold hydrolase [Bacteroidales bacterium]
MLIFIWILVILLLIAFVLFLLILKAFKNPVRPHDKTPEDIDIPYKEITIPTKNNCWLYGWWIPGKEKAPLLVLVHGWGRNAGRMMPYIEKFHKTGFNLVAFDSRNHGSSDADQHSTMLKFAEDILATIEYTSKQGWINSINVGLLGLSIGGAASIYAAAHDDRIKAVITVGAFAEPQSVMNKQLTDRHIPTPIIWASLKYAQYKVGFKFSDIAPVNHIQNASADFLLIHGEKDKTVPITQGEKLFEKGNKDKIELWKLPEKGHSDCHFEEGYWEKVIGFMGSKLFQLEKRPPFL